jgi:hypothetical protein
MTATKSDKLKQIVKLLEFALKLDDDEIIKSTLATVIEMLKEMT